MNRFVLALVVALGLLGVAGALPANYDRSIANVLASEGGYTNDRADPGGPTNFGITIYDYRKYVKPDATAKDVRAMKKSEAVEIYRTKYWAAVRGDELCAGLDYTLFDYGVNSGVLRAWKVLYRELGLPADTRPDSYAIMTALGGHDCADLVDKINDERLRFLRSLHTWPVFGGGWGRRVTSVKQISLAMAGRMPHGFMKLDMKPALGPHKAYAPDEQEIMP